MAAPSPEPQADICLVLEGTYPYVSGGVSTWVHQLLQMFPEWRFALFYLGAQKDPGNLPKYELPPNVIGLQEVYLFETAAERRLFAGSMAAWRPFYEAVRKLGLHPPAGDQADMDLLRIIFEHVAAQPRMDFETFWNSEQTWGVVQEIYHRYVADESFINFFWTTKFLLQPLWKLARALGSAPRARLYHTACTGYAGIAAALLSAREDKPLLLTEHGIYLRERIADICRSQWIPEQLSRHPNLSEPLGSLRRLWIGFFDLCGKLCYQQSSEIVSLFGKNAAAQVYFGADPARLSIIPNGIRTEDFLPLKEKRDERRRRQPDSRVVGFLGRVVSIKDVKTLLRAARRVCDTLPDAAFLIAGPCEEEPEYYQECLELVEQLHLGAHVKFLGSLQRGDFLPMIDLMILTSISEGLPFVIIESLASGVPVVSTDVGACSELLNGQPDETPAHGPAGLVAEIGNSEELARHVITLLADPATMNSMSQAGLERVRRLYHEDTIMQAYRQLYARHLQQEDHG